MSLESLKAHFADATVQKMANFGAPADVLTTIEQIISTFKQYVPQVEALLNLLMAAFPGSSLATIVQTLEGILNIIFPPAPAA